MIVGRGSCKHINFKGHAGQAEKGQDLICSAASCAEIKFNAISEK